jgi:tetratricopeptide (TPR) repeat protein
MAPQPFASGQNSQLSTPPVPTAQPSPELPPGLSYPLPPPPPPRSASSADNPVITGRHAQQPMPGEKSNTQAYPQGHPLAAKPQVDQNFLKRTAQKLVSRIKMAQIQADAEQMARDEELRKQQIERAAERLKSQERITESQRLRCVELDALSETHGEIALRKRVDWRKDKATLMGALVTVVVLAGVILCMVLSAATSPDKHLQLGQQYLKDNKPDRAIAELTLILGPQPTHAKALALRAEAYQQNNQWKDAIADYEKLQQVDPKAMSTTMGAKRALMLYKLGRYDEALKVAEQLSYQAPDPMVTALHGMTLARTGKYGDGLQNLKDPPKELENLALIDRAFCNWNMKQLPKALALYTAAVEALPQDAQPRRERALVEKDMGKMRAAISDLKAATDLDPQAGENFSLLGQLHQQLGEDDLAIVNYRSAIALQYNPVKCYTEIGRCQIKQKLYSDAETTIQKALAADPNDEGAQKLAVQIRGLLKTRSATTESATLEPITDINSADAKTLVKQGAAALKRGAAEQAVQYLKAAIDKGASDTHTRVMLAHALMNAGDYKKAYQHFLSLEHTGSLDQGERFTSGKCAVAAGLKEDGIKIISRCIQERPNWMEARIELIKVLVAADRRGEAQAVANQGVSLASSEYEKTLYQSAAKR